MSVETNSKNEGRVSVRQRWTEALIVGGSIGLIVFFVQMFLESAGFLKQTLAFVAAGLVVYLIQVAVSNWSRRG